MNVTLIFPRMKYGEHSPPLGLGYIAAVLEQAGHEVAIIDLTFAKDFMFLKSCLQQRAPRLIGVSCQTTFAAEAFEAVRISKEIHPAATVVIGGPHSTVLPAQTLQESGADCVAIGEGEQICVALVAALEAGEPLANVKGIYHRAAGKTVYTGKHEFITDLDKLPFPARHLFDARYFLRDEITLIASRGCPFHCAFCQPTLKLLFGERVRTRTPENVVAEMRSVRETYGDKTVRFHDDTFTFNRQWIEHFCRLLRKEKEVFRWECKSRIDVLDRQSIRLLKQAGCSRIDLGVESGSPRIVVEVLRKGVVLEKAIQVFRWCWQEKLFALAFIMIGNPTETPGDLFQTFRLLERLPFAGLHVSLFTPFPGTSLYDYATKEGLIRASSWREFDFYSQVSLHSPYFSPPEILEMKRVLEQVVPVLRLRRQPLKLFLFAIRHPRTFLLYCRRWLRFKRLKRRLSIRRNEANVKKE